MGWFSPDIETMNDLFLHTLQDIFYAENRIGQQLPEMADKASDRELKRSLQAHLRQTRGHIKRLERIFKTMGVKPKGTRCPAIDGILDEANEIAGEVGDKIVLDAALIAAAQAVEHYEITRYGTLVSWAKLLGHADAAKLLSATLKEEKVADKTLGDIARRKINRRTVKNRPAVPDSRVEDKLLEARAGIPVV